MSKSETGVYSMGAATFKCKYYGTGYDSKMVYMDYEYRGRIYTVYENRGKGNEPLSWQHRNAQADIDRAIEREMKQGPEKEWTYEGSAQQAFDKWFDEFCK